MKNNKNVIPGKYSLVFDIKIKTSCIRWLKQTYILKCLQFHCQRINNKNLQSLTINGKNE